MYVNRQFIVKICLMFDDTSNTRVNHLYKILLKDNSNEMLLTIPCRLASAFQCLKRNEIHDSPDVWVGILRNNAVK